MQSVPSEGPARPRWGSGPPLSLRVWERKEAPGLGSPSQLAGAVNAGHGTAKSAFPSGRRCRVSHPERERRGAGQPPPWFQLRGGLWCVAEAPGPGSSPLARPVGAARRGAGGRRQLPGAGGRRGSATVTAAAGSRRKLGLGMGGAAAPGEAQGSWLTAAPVVAGADLRRPLSLPGKDGPWSVSAPNPREVGRGRSPRVSVCRCAFHLHTLSALHPHRPQLCGWPLPRLPPPGPRAANPASRQALTSRMGPCFSSRTIRAPPLLAIFPRGHLQRLRGDFLPAFTKLVTPLTKNTRGNHKLNI